VSTKEIHLRKISDASLYCLQDKASQDKAIQDKWVFFLMWDKGLEMLWDKGLEMLWDFWVWCVKIQNAVYSTPIQATLPRE
jgi:hypothetical protein